MPSSPQWQAVEVLWDDAHTDNGWAEWEGASHKPSRVRSVGMVAKRDATGITLVTSVSAHEEGEKHDVNCVTFIPAGMIQRVKRLS